MNPAPRRATRQHERAAAARRRVESRRDKARCPVAGKSRLPDFDRAIAAALRLSTVLGRPIRIYLCPDCDGWHLTRRRTPPKDTPC